MKTPQTALLPGLLLLLFASSCRYQGDYREEIVVEAWIESGEHPVVILSSTVPIDDDSYSDSELMNHVINWGKVSVSDGEQTAILAGGIDRHYLPPYIYTTSDIKGEPGKTYTLTVEYSGKVLTASTTIPEVPVIDSVQFESIDGDSLFEMTVSFEDNADTHDYYMFFVRLFNRESRYYPASTSLIDDAQIADAQSLAGHKRLIERPVWQGYHTLPFQEYSSYYRSGDSIMVKLAAMDNQSFLFWDSYSKTVNLEQVALFTVPEEIHSNIEGGLGYWCGYAIDRRSVICP